MLNPPNLGFVGSTSATIDNNNVLTVNWLPPAGPAYTGWEIILNGLPAASIPAPNPYTGTPRFYTTQLSTGSYRMDMQTNLAGSPPASFDWEVYNTPVPNIWNNVSSLTPSGLAFPDAIVSADVVFSSTTLQLGQPLTLQLAPAYVNADQWQVLWPDGSSTGWLPLSASLLTKQFSISGPLDVVIQTRKLYNSSIYSPSVVLMRQLTVGIFVVDQQFTGTTTTSTSLTGTLGIGGQQGFEITGATGVASTANPWEVIARFLVRDTLTNEIKLGIATTRFSNASSLLGTMGIDVFPIEGRPKSKELIVPVYENSFNALTSSIPVTITTTQLPTTIYVGKAMQEFQMAASGGTPPYAWYTDGLPAGLKLSINGVLSGTPLALGTYSINFAVQDSSVPFFIAEAAFSITVSTDLLVEIALGQTDAKGNVLTQLGTSLGIAQVGTPYSVQMEVGNVNPANPIPGGLPPYTWSIPAGNLPIGLSINPNTGLISGTPSTYNSTSDFTKTFSAVVQVTDAIGAIATQTYTMTLVPQALQFGSLDQPTIYAGQQFGMMVPVFGGVFPYTFLGLAPFGNSSYYGPATLVDGQIEFDVNFPTAGSYSFILVLRDSASPNTMISTQFTITVEPAISDPILVPAFVDHVWNFADTFKATPFAITGNLAGFTLGGTYVSLGSVAPTVVNNPSPSPAALYTDTLGFCSGGGDNAYAGLTFIVSGFQNAANNGTFLCFSSTANSLTLLNATPVAETVPVLGYISSLTQAFPTPLPAGSTGTLSSPVAPFAPTTTYTFATSQPSAAKNALIGQQFTVSGFNQSVNNGTFYCVDSTHLQLILSNPNGTTATAPSGTYSLVSAISGSASGSIVTTELGTAATYAILAAAVVSSATIANVAGGNVGSVPTNTITGTFNYTPPAQQVVAVAQNQTDLTAAFVFFNGLTSTAISASYATHTFTATPTGYNGGPGFVGFASSTLLFTGGTITLDGAGLTNPVFVFQVGSALNVTTAATTIALINGATAANVVWVVGSAATFDAHDHVWAGNILATSAITLNSISLMTLNGRALVTTGPVTISGTVTITASAGSGSPSTTIYTAAPFTFPALTVGSPITVSGFDYLGNDGTFAVVSNTSSQLILENSNGSPTIDYAAGSPPSATATQGAVAAQLAAKALQVQAGAVLSDGIVVAIDPVIPEVEISGPPSGVYGNVQYMLPLLLQLQGITEATASQAYTILTHDDAASLGWVPGVDIGTINTNTRPYIIGEVVGLNPRQPYYNSPFVPSITPTSPVPSDAPWIATVPATVQGVTNTLPPGLSLDAHTGLIYGTLTGTVSASFTSVIQYVGTSGTIHGTVTIAWNTVASAFSPIDNIQDSVSLGTALTNTSYITVPASVTPISASVYYARGSSSGTLPAGLTLDSTPTGQNFYITGTPTESGYFDVWFQIVASTGTAYLYHRLSIDFAAPLTIVTTLLPPFSDSIYSYPLQGFGGFPPYTTPNGWTATGLPPGFVLNQNTGVLSAPAFAWEGPPTNYVSGTTAIPITVTLADTRGAGSSVSAILTLNYNSSLRIVTGPTPNILGVGIATVTDDPNGYSFQMQAAGGTPFGGPNPYTWAEVGALPTGITFNTSTGVFSGTYSGATGLNFPITVTATDSVAGSTGPVSFTIQTVSVLTGAINDSGVGIVPRGEVYQGTLVATLCMTPPIQWQVAPTSGYPDLLPAGLSLQVNGIGATATIAGTYSGGPLTGASGAHPWQVRILAVDSLGDTAEIIVPFTTGTDLTIVGWDYADPLLHIGIQPFPLPNAVIGATYYNGSASGIQLVATGGVPIGVLPNGYNQYSWTSVNFPLHGISLSSAGVLTGSANTQFSQSVTFVVADTLTPPNTASVTTTFASQTSALTITTVSLPAITAGVAYSAPLTETGALGTPTWSIVGGALPSGLSLSSTTGATVNIVGTTIQIGLPPVTFRVTDVGGPNNGAYFDRTFPLTVASGLVLHTGIDYTDSTSYNILGYVDKGNVVSISPRTNLSFYVIGTNVITTNPALLGIIVSGGFTVGTVTISGGVAKIPLTGPFASGSPGNNTLSISVTDSGVTATKTFTWVVYDDGALRLAPQTGSFPVKLTTPN